MRRVEKILEERDAEKEKKINILTVIFICAKVSGVWVENICPKYLREERQQSPDILVDQDYFLSEGEKSESMYSYPRPFWDIWNRSQIFKQRHNKSEFAFELFSSRDLLQRRRREREHRLGLLVIWSETYTKRWRICSKYLSREKQYSPGIMWKRLYLKYVRASQKYSFKSREENEHDLMGQIWCETCIRI